MKKLIAALAFAAFATVAFAQTPASTTTQTTTTTQKKKVVAAVPAPTEQEIADARAKGLVWVNTSTKAYHKEGKYYGCLLYTSTLMPFQFGRSDSITTRMRPVI